MLDKDLKEQLQGVFAELKPSIELAVDASDHDQPRSRTRSNEHVDGHPDLRARRRARDNNAESVASDAELVETEGRV